MILPFLPITYQDIFNDLYEITNGKIILGGSGSLFILGIIDRKINDLDVNIMIEDWLIYKEKIEKKYKIYPGVKINHDILDYEMYKCFNKTTKLEEFHLFLDYGVNTFNTIELNDGLLRVFKPEKQLIDKKMISKYGHQETKHMEDIKLISDFLNEK